MSAHLFPDFERINLNEDKGDKNTSHSFTGIVLDPKRNAFKVISGTYDDKKDMYEKLAAQGLVLRKCFESEIWDWIERNAPDDLTAYLMYSTAFSKWKNNNILGDYYIRLLNDLPGITREGTKGNPGTKGENTNRLKKESVYLDAIKQLILEADGKEVYVTAYYYTPDNDNVDTEANFTAQVPDTANFRYKDLFNDKKFLYAVTNGVLKTPIDDEPRYSKVKLNVYSDKNHDNLITEPKVYTSNDLYNAMMNRGSSEEKEYKNSSLHRSEALNRINTIKQGRDLLGKLSTSSELYEPLSNSIKSQQSVISNLNRLNRTTLDKNEHNLLNALEVVDGFIKTKNPSSILSNLSGFTFNKQSNNIFDMIKYARGGLALKKDALQQQYTNRINSIENKIKSLRDAKEDTAGEERRLKEVKDDRDTTLDKYDDISEELLDYQKKLLAVKDNYEKEGPLQPGMDSAAYFTKVFEPFNLDKEVRDSGKVKVRIADENIDELEKSIYSIIADTKQEDERNKDIRNSDTRFIQQRNQIDKLGQQQVKAMQPINSINPKFSRGSDEVSWLNSMSNLEKSTGVKNGFSKPEQDKVSLSKDTVKNIKNKNTEDKINKYSAELADIANAVRINNNDITDEQYNRAVYLKNKIAELKSSLDESIDEAFVNDGANDYGAANPHEKELYNTVPGSLLPLAGNVITEENTNDKLNPELFDGDNLKEDVREKLLVIADKFKNSLELPFEPVDVYFTGSCANYNYNNKSDIDLHLVYDYEKAGINAEIINKYLKAAKMNFNNKYNITIKNIPVELGTENVAEPLVSTGVYSLLKNTWISKPTYKNVEIPELDNIIYNEIVSQIEKAIESKDGEVLKSIIKYIAKLRKFSLAKDGEFGKGNLLFKRLRNDNYITRLKDAYYAATSNELSLESLEEDML